jgi:1-phosphatidylinositol-4-phosphate 5-kinase
MDYSLLVGVHFRDTRDRLLTGGWLKQNNFNNLSYGYHVPYKVHCPALLEGSFDSDSSRGSSPHLSRGDTDPNR